MSPEAETYLDLIATAVENKDAKKLLHYAEQVLPMLCEDQSANADDIEFVNEAINCAKQIIALENITENLVENVLVANSLQTSSDRIKLK